MSKILEKSGKSQGIPSATNCRNHDIENTTICNVLRYCVFDVLGCLVASRSDMYRPHNAIRRWHHDECSTSVLQGKTSNQDRSPQIYGHGQQRWKFINAHVTYPLSHYRSQWRIQNFLDGGVGATPKMGAPTACLAKFSQKLHENDRNWTGWPGKGAWGRGACLDPLEFATGSICY